MTDRVRVAVAGLGAVAQAVHLPLLARRDDLFAISALCDLSPSRTATTAARYGVPEQARFSTVEQMLESGGFDALLLLTSGSHGLDALQAVRRGVPVFCEKPLAYSRAEAQAIIDAAGPGGPRLQVGYMKQYDVGTQQLAAALSGIDDVRSVDVEVLHPADGAQLAFANLPVPADDADPGTLAGLRSRDDAMLGKALGGTTDAVRALYSGVVLGSVIHDLSLVRMLVGSPERIDHVQLWPHDAAPGSVEVSATLPGAARLSLRWHFLHDYPAYRETVTVHHGRGSLALTFPSPYLLNAPTELLVVDGVGGGERRSVHRSVVEEFEQELIGFHAMVTDGVPPLSGPVEGLADIVTGQRIVRAWCEQQSLPIGGEAVTA